MHPSKMMTIALLPANRRNSHRPLKAIWKENAFINGTAGSTYTHRAGLYLLGAFKVCERWSP